MIFNIDLDRGVHSRSDPGTSSEVYMYVDEPGVYRSAHGTEVGIEMARRAGFPVDEQLKKRRIQLALKAATDKVLSELAEADQGEKAVVAEKEGFQIVDLGYDRFQVKSPDGDVLNSRPLARREADILLDQLVPDPEPVEEVPDTKGKMTPLK